MGKPSSRVSKVLMSGPLAPFADAFAVDLRRRGYTELTTVVELRQVGRLSGWLDAHGFSAEDLGRGLVEQFLAWQRTGGRHRAGWSRPGLLCLVEVLNSLGVLQSDKPMPLSSPTDQLLSS